MAKKNKYVYGNEFQSRSMFLVLYPESQQNIIDNLLNSSIDYCGILHDKDMTDSGEIKKPHYHFLLQFDNPKLASTVCRQLGFEFNKNKDGTGIPPYIEPCRKFKDCAKYLVHKGEEDKYQYEKECLFGSLTESVTKLLVEPDENTQMRLLMDIFDNYNGLLTFRTALNLALKYNLYSTFRRGGSLLVKVIEEYQHEDMEIEHRKASDMYNKYKDKYDKLKGFD